MLKRMNGRDILMHAADLIEARGHAKKILHAANGSLCFNGAILTALGAELDEYSRFNYQTDENQSKVGRITSYVMPFLKEHPVNWNNRPERTKEEVVAKMRELAVTVPELELV